MRGKVLLDAHALINGERRTQYGQPENSFPVIASLWNSYLFGKGATEVYLDDKDVALMMVLMKISRELNGYKDDNWTDMAGYIGIGSDLAQQDAEFEDAHAKLEQEVNCAPPPYVNQCLRRPADTSCWPISLGK